MNNAYNRKKIYERNQQSTKESKLQSKVNCVILIIKVGLLVVTVTVLFIFCQIGFFFSDYKLASKNSFSCFVSLSNRSIR